MAKIAKKKTTEPRPQEGKSPWFRVWRRSENTNSFGLRQYYLIAGDRPEVWTICRGALHDMKIGDRLGAYMTPAGEVSHFPDSELPERVRPDPPRAVEVKIRKMLRKCKI